MGHRVEKFVMGRRFAGTMAAILLVLLAAEPRAAAQGHSYEGTRVSTVRVVDETGQEIAATRTPIPLQAGQPFQMDTERKSLRALYLTGLYADVRTEAIETAQGLDIAFVVRRNYYNNMVRIAGIDDDRLLSRSLGAMGLPLGQIFEESAVRDGIGRLKEALQGEGYYEPHVTYQLGPNEKTRQMDVQVAVVLGLRARLGKITFQNQSGYTDEELRKKSKLSSGQQVNSSRLERARDRIQKYLHSKEYLQAHVSIKRGTYEPSQKRVPVNLVVVGGPRVRVVVDGAKYSQRRLKKLIPIFEEDSVDEDLLTEGRRNLRDDQQKHGYFDAQVSFVRFQNPQTQEHVITYTVDRGQKHRLAGISIEGNKYLGTELLESRLTIHKATLLTSGRFSEQLLQQDASSMQTIYQANGFLQSKVEAKEELNYKGRAKDVFVRFLVTEGPQTRVGSLNFEGNHDVPAGKLLAVVGSTAGEPYSESNVSSDRDNVLAYYFNEGFPQAQFTSEAVESKTSPHRMDLTYKIVEGPRVRVDNVYLTGYHYTRRGVIARQVAVKPDEPLRQSDVILTQRKLYDLGIFNRAVVAPQNPDGTDPDKNVVVGVEEAKRYTIGYGGGFEVQEVGGSAGSPGQTQLNASPLGIFEISRNNVGGRAQSLGFQARASTLEYQGLVSYNIPDFFSHDRFSLQLSGLAAKSEEVQTFTSRRYEGSLQLTERLTPRTSLIYRYTFRRVLAEVNTLELPTEEIPLFNQPTLLSGFGFTWIRDARDDPADAKRGSFNTVDVSQSARSLGSGAGYFRGYLQNSTFHTFGKSLVFARSVRFGLEETFPGSIPDNIPLPERFFAGGGTTLRGFGLNDAGPRDPTTGFPVGGLAQLLFNQELRFPMTLPVVGKRLGGTFFYDAGNVYRSVNDITLRWTSKSQRDLEYMSQTVGFGLRYNTPVGPVRVDFGYQLNPAKFLFYNPNTRFYQTNQLPHFQFFFSIGSVF
jgi:outer membrane protein assembly complex protein YaeT